MTLYIWNPPTICSCLNEYIGHKISCNKKKEKEKIENNANPDNESQMSVIWVPGFFLATWTNCDETLLEYFLLHQDVTEKKRSLDWTRA